MKISKASNFILWIDFDALFFVTASLQGGCSKEKDYEQMSGIPGEEVVDRLMLKI
ncbi:MAG: hypothetical protein II919_09785 [Lachnospiraceae bacterium]|nr:hypothetical protein [Lachnospiraceae bacterium]